MSSSESGLSDTVGPMAIVSDDGIIPELEIFTSDTESDPEMMSDDDDDFQPFALPDFGDDVPHADGPSHPHPDGEHVVAPIPVPLPLAAFPFEDLPFDDLFDDDVDLFDGPADGAQGDGVVAEDAIVVPLVEIPIIDISSDHSVPDSFESVSSSALQEVPAPEPVPSPEPLPDFDPVPFGTPDIAPLIPDPVPTPTDPIAFASQTDPRYAFNSNGWIDDDDDDVPLSIHDSASQVDPRYPDPPVIEPVTPPHAPALFDVASFHPVESDVHRTDLPITYLQDIPAPRPGEGPSSQQPGYDPRVSAAFPHMPQYTPTAHFTSSPLDEPFRWFPPYTMPTSDPYNPSHFSGYTRDELLLSLQLQYEIMSRRVLELEMIPRPPPCSCPSPFATPPSPILPYPDFDIRFLTMEQHISYLLRRVYDLEEELAHVRSLLFVPPPPPPPPSA
ncbi:cell surface glycoprotein 1-like [Helianthus annuus]|uniref:cell surface glycoprotein 1-like n=1 Tax=Helianthus annuus TaxID=4232 RepID=UPI000B8FA087|nr:cell surface glycoprotein 1-like [Helianthus annuus]